MTRKTRKKNKSQGADLEAQPEDEEVRRKGAHETSSLTSGREGEATRSSEPVMEVDREAQVGSSTRSQARAPKNDFGSGESVHVGDDRAAGNTAQPMPSESESPRMIGDFNDNANALWSLHLKEAMSHDEARIQSLKDHMDGVLIFAGLFSAALTSFLVDKIHDLQVDPAQQMVYYQRQNVALLAQISNQVSSIAPQVPIPSAPPPPFPDFSPTPSDVRVNVFWFMSLVFSISAALLATLVQQWVRDYMHVFKRYSNPLKSARLRQYLYEGAEGWYMPVVAESVPGLVHVSLFLFFLGLGDSLLAVHTTVGVTTVVPIAICGLFYVFSMFAPVIKPQSPFRNPFSGLIWYLRQKVHPRSYSDRASGSLETVSPNISEGQMQLAMEENDERKDRDVRAIRWLIHNRTEDDEMESFVMAIPGAFTSKWGIYVWKKASEVKQYEDTDSRPVNAIARSQSDADLRVSVPLHHHSPLFQRTWNPLGLLRPLGRIIGIRITNGTPPDVMPPRLPSDDQDADDPYALAIYDLCNRVRHLLGTCDNHSIFTNHELWYKRARGCVETAASLVICADMRPELFGDIGRSIPLLHEFIKSKGDYQIAPGSDGLFVARLECLSFVIVNRAMSADRERIKLDAHVAIDILSQFKMDDDDDDRQTNNDDVDEDALKNARRIDEDFENVRQFCVYGLRRAFKPSDAGMALTEEQAREILTRDHEVNISMLERITPAADRLANIDRAISRINDSVRTSANGLLYCARGAQFDTFEETELLQPIQFFDPTPHKVRFFTQFILLHQRLRLLCSYSSKLRDIIDGRGDGAYQEILQSLGTLWGESDARKRSGVRQRHIMERQLWRLQDLRDGGGFGFWVELFFLIAEQLLTIPLSPDAHSALLVGMFRVITSNWREHKHSIGTQRVILNLVCDMAILDRGLFSDIVFPRYITDELLILLENMVEGQSGSHIDDAMKELDDAIKKQDNAIEEDNVFRRQDPVPDWMTESVRLFKEKVVEAISRSRGYRSLVIE